MRPKYFLTVSVWHICAFQHCDKKFHAKTSQNCMHSSWLIHLHRGYMYLCVNEDVNRKENTVSFWHGNRHPWHLCCSPYLTWKWKGNHFLFLITNYFEGFMALFWLSQSVGREGLGSLGGKRKEMRSRQRRTANFWSKGCFAGQGGDSCTVFSPDLNLNSI